MRRYYEIAAICALYLMIVVLPASAGTINNFSNVQLTGNSNSTVSGSFSFNATTHVFSNIAISFNGGAFNGVQANQAMGQAHYIAGQGYVFTWNTNVNGNWIGNMVVFTSSGQFHEYGGIAKGNKYGGFDYLLVPEGGTQLSYLMLSGIAVFGGLLLSGKRRRSALAQSS
jgi:hypothetical protein